MVVAEVLDRLLEHLSGVLDETVFLLEPGELQPVLHVWMHAHEPSVGLPGPLDLPVAQFEIDVRLPGLLLWLQFHPAFEYLPCAGDIAEDLFHVGVLVPELAIPGHQCDGTMKNVASPTYLTVPHFHFGISQPNGRVFVMHIQATLKHSSGSFDFMLRILELGVFDPVGQDESILAY